MKEQPKKRRAKPGFDPDSFIRQAKTALPDTPPGSAERKSKKHPAVGYKRVTFDVQMDLHEALDREAFDTKRKRREIVEDILRERYTSHKFQKYLSV